MSSGDPEMESLRLNSGDPESTILYQLTNELGRARE